MKFEIDDFTNVCKFIVCRTSKEFAEMYESLGFENKTYIEMNRAKAIDNFINWWCNLDKETQEKITTYVKNFYSN
jgi:hypothetical protein